MAPPCSAGRFVCVPLGLRGWGICLYIRLSANSVEGTAVVETFIVQVLVMLRLYVRKMWRTDFDLRLLL